MNISKSFNRSLIKTFNVSDKDIFNCSSSSKGNQTKYFVDGYFIKRDYLGYEYISEVISSMLSSCIQDFSYVKYDFCNILYKGVKYTDCCYSKNFLNNGERLISLYRLFEYINIDIDRYLKNYSTDICLMKIKDLFNLTQGTINSICKMLLFDSIILNEDRHFNNICFVINNSNSINLSPVFDNGGALLSDINDYPLITSEWVHMRNVKAKPFSTSFSKQIKGVLKLGTEPLKIDIDKFNLLVKNIKVTNEYEKYLERTLSVLKTRLNELEGKVWQST